MRRIHVAAMARTPFGKFRGCLSSLSAIEIGARLIDALLARNDGAPGIVHGGAGLLGGSHLTTLRQSIIRSGLPDETPSLGVDRACCSGMTAIASAAMWLRSGAGDKALALGVESLSNTPVLLHRGSESKINRLGLVDPLLLSGTVSEKTIAQYTSEEAQKYRVGREEPDIWALRSHERYFAGRPSGIFDDQIVPIEVAGQEIAEDEGPRENSSLEKLASLKTVNGSATITAGNAPGLSDGAAGLILVAGNETPVNGQTPSAEILDWVQLAGELQTGTSIPATGILRLLQRNHRSLDQIDVIEINEAFAATPLVSTSVLARETGMDLTALREKTNAHGGAVAIGHPLGASGIRIVMQAISRLRARGGGTAVCAICGGFGQGEALLLKV
ncbi:MAG: thiolase family protein [Mesorhizobium sp.]